METTTSKRLYEAMFLIDSGLAAAQWDSMQAAIRRFFERADATVVSMKKWDERKLAYTIQGKSRGTYILCYFECDPLRISGIERDVTLSEQILRVMILRTDCMSREDIEKATPLELIQNESVEETPAAAPAEPKPEPAPAPEAAKAESETAEQEEKPEGAE